MPPFVGVTAYTAFDSARAKRDLLLFDQLAIPGLPLLFQRLLEEKDKGDHVIADMEWLQTQNLITEATLLAGDATTELLFEVEKDVTQYPNIFTRLVAQDLRETK